MRQLDPLHLHIRHLLVDVAAVTRPATLCGVIVRVDVVIDGIIRAAWWVVVKVHQLAWDISSFCAIDLCTDEDAEVGPDRGEEKGGQCGSEGQHCQGRLVMMWKKVICEEVARG